MNLKPWLPCHVVLVRAEGVQPLVLSISFQHKLQFNFVTMTNVSVSSKTRVDDEQ